MTRVAVRAVVVASVGLDSIAISNQAMGSNGAPPEPPKGPSDEEMAAVVLDDIRDRLAYLAQTFPNTAAGREAQSILRARIIRKPRMSTVMLNRIYDVTDLVPHDDARILELDIESLIEDIINEVGQKSWGVAAQRSFAINLSPNRSIVIHHTRAVHRKIGEYLAVRREQLALRRMQQQLMQQQLIKQLR